MHYTEYGKAVKRTGYVTGYSVVLSVHSVPFRSVLEFGPVPTPPPHPLFQGPVLRFGFSPRSAKGVPPLATSGMEACSAYRNEKSKTEHAPQVHSAQVSGHVTRQSTALHMAYLPLQYSCCTLAWTFHMFTCVHPHGHGHAHGHRWPSVHDRGYHSRTNDVGILERNGTAERGHACEGGWGSSGVNPRRSSKEWYASQENYAQGCSLRWQQVAAWRCGCARRVSPVDQTRHATEEHSPRGARQCQAVVPESHRPP